MQLNPDSPFTQKQTLVVEVNTDPSVA